MVEQQHKRLRRLSVIEDVEEIKESEAVAFREREFLHDRLERLMIPIIAEMKSFPNFDAILDFLQVQLFQPISSNTDLEVLLAMIKETQSLSNVLTNFDPAAIEQQALIAVEQYRRFVSIVHKFISRPDFQVLYDQWLQRYQRQILSLFHGSTQILLGQRTPHLLLADTLLPFAAQYASIGENNLVRGVPITDQLIDIVRKSLETVTGDKTSEELLESSLRRNILHINDAFMRLLLAAPAPYLLMIKDGWFEFDNEDIRDTLTHAVGYFRGSDVPRVLHSLTTAYNPLTLHEPVYSFAYSMTQHIGRIFMPWVTIIMWEVMTDVGRDMSWWNSHVTRLITVVPDPADAHVIGLSARFVGLPLPSAGILTAKEKELAWKSLQTIFAEDADYETAWSVFERFIEREMRALKQVKDTLENDWRRLQQIYNQYLLEFGTSEQRHSEIVLALSGRQARPASTSSGLWPVLDLVSDYAAAYDGGRRRRRSQI
jgi:hypothetical protein